MPVLPREYDMISVVGLALVFGLPLTLLIPNFSIWDVVPKIHVWRYHAFSQVVTWNQLHGAIFVLLLVLFCLMLEFRKRKLDDIVEAVLNASRATESMLAVEKEKQVAAVRACAKLLDSSAEHYENLMLLREELRRRKQQPPAIEPSESDGIQQASGTVTGLVR